MRPSLPGETGRHSAQQLIRTLNREKEGGIFLIFEGEEDIYLRRADNHQALHSFFFGGMWRVVFALLSTFLGMKPVVFALFGSRPLVRLWVAVCWAGPANFNFN